MSRPGTCHVCGGPTSKTKHTTCAKCFDCGPGVILMREAAQEAAAARSAAHLEDVLWLIDSGLPCWEVTRRFGVQIGSIARLLERHGHPDKAAPFERIRQQERRQRARENRPERPRGFGRRLAPCGTYTAYRRHVNWGEPVDDACREAMRAAGAQFRAKRRRAA